MTLVLGDKFRKYLEENGESWEYDTPTGRSGLVDSQELAAAVRKNLGDRFRAEGRGVDLARAVEPLVDLLKIGAVPLPAQIQAALDRAAMLTSGQSVRCDSVSPRNWGTLGPALAEKLSALSRGARLATGSDLRRVAAAIEVELAEMVTKADVGRGRFAKCEVEARVQTAATFEKSAGLLGDKLNDEYESLLKAYQGYQAAYQHPDLKIECGCRLRNCTHFVAIEKALHIAMALRKRNRGEIVAGRRRRG